MVSSETTVLSKLVTLETLKEMYRVDMINANDYKKQLWHLYLTSAPTYMKNDLAQKSDALTE